jgi:hypothetical protein
MIDELFLLNYVALLYPMLTNHVYTLKLEVGWYSDDHGVKVATMVHSVSATPWSVCDCVLWGERLTVDEEVHTGGNEQQKIIKAK